ncbi:mannose-1-phosphate guanylyltransferase/mannose-6-phosphate isomerase [Thiogranum longum]|uniref:mannose-1-phosphate guanylyltransferase n=1 Tax=Thiogranum longum TaxID=1537524 RepID=A0A4R1H8D3_9GAMM|nr:mannose-1-phosphate guanylyltransferase/mannose-6-phosphate isomerase [Thiogranum longum]TCK18097.1 mannose-1-phosphate guanylyltransferase/mannose-6-phosphate isomerase [Thiogranum longum]
MHYYPVILSGGAGSRLWPASREFYPKPMLPMFGKHTLLQDTTTRLDGVDSVQSPLFVCNEEHRFLVAEQVRALDKEAEAIMLEPEGRNTAPALTLAALHLAGKDPDAVMVVMPADHVIPDRASFTETVERGGELAQKGYLVTFGVVADKPETGYGYINRGKEIEDSGSFTVDRFVEKPDATTAQGYVDSGDYYWNSGIFVMRADRWLEEIGKYQPDILAACRVAMEHGKSDADFLRADKSAFLESPSDSIDYAVMEKTDRAAVVPMETHWSDVGSWSSIWEVSERDEDGNVARGDVLTHDTKNSLLMADQRCIAAVGLDNMIVVETADAVLVADKRNSQDVKSIVSQLKASDREEYRFHSRVYRPWGDYEGIDNGARYQVKRLTVKPGAQLSLQMHHHRAEHWIVVSGTAKVTRGDDVFMLSENESTYIPLGTTHRLENPGNIPLEIIEVQSGSYLGEDDIVRFEDVYNRVE